MATVVTPVPRQHTFWVRVLEDLGLVAAVVVVGWTLLTALGFRQTAWEAVAMAPGMPGSRSLDISEPLPLVPASRPMMAAVAVAERLEEQGNFGPETQAAWRKALDECRRFSVQPITATRGTPVMLWLLEPETARAAELLLRIEDPATPPAERATLEALREEALANADVIGRYRDVVNFDYWRATCEQGATADGLADRAAAWRADREADQAPQLN